MVPWPDGQGSVPEPTREHRVRFPLPHADYLPFLIFRKAIFFFFLSDFDRLHIALEHINFFSF